MAKLPDFETLLPSAAREAVRDFVWAKLRTSSFNYLANPTYDSVAFRKDLDKTKQDSDSWSYHMAVDVFREIEHAFNLKYPKQWDNDKQRAFRNIDGDLKYSGL